MAATVFRIVVMALPVGAHRNRTELVLPLDKSQPSR
jgi:hypothetical protein